MLVRQIPADIGVSMHLAQPLVTEVNNIFVDDEPDVKGSVQEVENMLQELRLSPTTTSRNRVGISIWWF